MNIIFKYIWITNFSNYFVFTGFISYKIFFTTRRNCIIKGTSPPNYAVFININFCIIFLL